ncbi:hypothetical protein KCU65_g380, partial [Aureobasidium melanogenum]
MNVQRPLRDDVTNLEVRVCDLESRTSILASPPLLTHHPIPTDTTLQCAEQIYDAIKTQQACNSTLEAVTHIARETKQLKTIIPDGLETITQTSVEVNKKIEEADKKIERLEEELTEERKKRKALEMKMEVMYEWFKSQNR